MTSSLQINVFGEFTVRRGGAAVVLPPSRKTKALLAYLTVVRRPQRRERLCEMFWEIPDDPRGSLRWSLSKLRPVLSVDGELLLEADRNSVSVRSAAIELDYDLVRDLSPGDLSTLPLERLEALEAAFTGPFLSDLYLARCPEFEAWRASCGNETEVLRLKALRTLVDRLDDNPDRALVHAQTLQALCPEDDLGDEIERLVAQARAAVTARRPVPARPVTAAEPVATARRGPAAATAPQGDRRQATPRPQSVHFCHGADGVRIAYAVCGDGPPIVRSGHWMSHLEFDWESPVWGHWINALSDGFRFVRYDERLNGLSDQSAVDLSMDAMLADLECVVESARVDRFVLLGVSQGCAAAIRYAVRHPERVAGMVLYGGYLRGWRARGDASELARREAMAVLMREGWGRDDPSFRQLFTSLFIPGANREQMNWYNELQKRTVTPENAFRLSQAFADVDVSGVVDDVRVPTLVLHGRDDQIVPVSSGVEFAERIRGARFVELDTANHILLADEPAFERFVAETRTFARAVSGVPEPSASNGRTWRKAALLCADFVSPMQAFGHLDPDAAFEVVDPVVLRAAQLVRDNGGAIIGLSDTRLTASFEAADDREQPAASACRIALQLRGLIRDAPDSLVRVRVAIDTGDVVIAPARMAEVGVEVRGAPVSVVHALNAALRRDVVVVTDRVRVSVGDALPMVPLAADDLAGFPRGQPLFELVESPRASGDA